MSWNTCTPVGGSLHVVEVAMTRATCGVRIGSEERMFSGHFPGLPIFPGAGLLEYAHRAALACAPKSLLPLTLDAVESVRFIAPVRPDDEVRLQVAGAAEGRFWRCSVEVVAAGGPLARIRLRHRTEGPSAEL